MGFSAPAGVRFDSAWYLGPIDPGNRLGSIFDRTVPSLAYSKTRPSDPNEEVSDVAYHIETALQHPADTYPPKPDKKIAGGAANDPIHRLYTGFSPQNQARYDRNRAISEGLCDNNPQWTGYRDLGFSCDEYAFAASYEGAARFEFEDNDQFRDDISVKPVPRYVSENAGRKLAEFYGDDRPVSTRSAGRRFSRADRPEPQVIPLRTGRDRRSAQVRLQGPVPPGAVHPQPVRLARRPDLEDDR